VQVASCCPSPQTSTLTGRLMTAIRTSSIQVCAVVVECFLSARYTSPVIYRPDALQHSWRTGVFENMDESFAWHNLSLQGTPASQPSSSMYIALEAYLEEPESATCIDASGRSSRDFWRQQRQLCPSCIDCAGPVSAIHALYARRPQPASFTHTDKRQQPSRLYCGTFPRCRGLAAAHSAHTNRRLRPQPRLVPWPVAHGVNPRRISARKPLRLPHPRAPQRAAAHRVTCPATYRQARSCATSTARRAQP
jgi:hypothetical protein